MAVAPPAGGEQNPAYRPALRIHPPQPVLSVKHASPPHPGPVRPWAVVLAAGSGSRMAAAKLARPKQFLEYRGSPLYWHCARTFSRCARVAGIIFVFPEDRLAEEEARLRRLDGPAADARPGKTSTSLGLPWKAVAGGPLRQDSVSNALRTLPADCEYVLIHDAARPFMSAALTARLIEVLEQGAAGAIPGLPVSDTIKQVEEGQAAATLERETLYAVQTPQAFRLEALRAAHARARAKAGRRPTTPACWSAWGMRCALSPAKPETGRSPTRKTWTCCAARNGRHAWATATMCIVTEAGGP